MKRKIKYILPNRHYFQYLGLLIFALLLFTGYALMPDDIDISLVLKKMKLPHSEIAFVNSSDTLARGDTLADEADEALLEEKSTADEADTTSQRFLLIGDSMSEFMRLRLNDYCAQNGHTMQTVIWYSSSTEWYGKCDTLAHFIRTYKPTYILLNLGSNELFIKDIKEKRSPYVKRILQQIGDIPYVWIGPPNWKEDTGINEMIVENVGLGHYFESKRLTFERGNDHAHPVPSSAYQWMDSIAVYLANSAAHRIRMDVPDTTAKGRPSTIVISPKSK